MGKNATSKKKWFQLEVEHTSSISIATLAQGTGPYTIMSCFMQTAMHTEQHLYHIDGTVLMLPQYCPLVMSLLATAFQHLFSSPGVNHVNAARYAMAHR